MNVVNGLARSRVHIEHGAVSFLMDIRLHCQFLGNLKHLANKRVIFRHKVVQRGYVLSWGDQEVHRRLWP
jgi:hypothetical protein